MIEKSNKLEAPSVVDPLMLGVDLPLRARFFARGFPVELATNSPLVLEAAEDSWASFPQHFRDPIVELRVAVDEQDASPLPPEPVFRAQKSLLAIVAGAGNFAVCDLAHCFSFCWVSASTAARKDYFRYHFLDPMALCILENQRLTSIHAACVALDGRGVLISGESGAGKSCLAFACARQGWTLVDDDGSSLVRGEDANLVLGDPFHLRFRESAVDLFPDLGEWPLSTTRKGELSIEISTAEMPEIETACSANVERVVFLERRARGSAQLFPMRRNEALRRLEADLAMYPEGGHDERRHSLSRLVHLEPCALRYSDLDSAVEKLEALLS